MKRVSVFAAILAVAGLPSFAEQATVLVEGLDSPFNGIPASFTRPVARPEAQPPLESPFYMRCWVSPATANAEGAAEGFCLDEVGQKITN